MKLAASAAAVISSVTLAAGCGGDGEPAGTEGASRVPASADLFIAFDTDFDGEQWNAAADLVDQFPGGDEAIRQLRESLQEDDVDFERDIKPAVGPEADVVILEFTAGEEPDAVGLVRVRDRDKFEALMAKGDDEDDETVYEIDGDWAILSDSQEAIDRFQQAAEDGDPLSESDRFNEAMGDLPEDALAKVYVNAQALVDLARAGADAEAEAQGLQQCAPGGQAEAIGAAVRVDDEGVRLDAHTPMEGDEAPDTYEAELPSALPAGALAYVSFNNVAEQIRAFIRCGGEANEDFDRYVAQFELALGVSLEEDVLPLFENEGALAVYRAAEGEAGADPRIPGVLLVLEVEDEANARETVDRLAERGAEFSEGQVTVADEEIEGIEATRVTFGDEFSLLYAVFDNRLVIASSEQTVAQLRADGDKLSDDETYTQVLDAADSPDETSGFFYANLEDAIAYGLELVEAEGETVPAQVRDNLEPLRSLVFWSTYEDGKARAAGLVRVE